MANRSFKRNIATLDNELVFIEGTLSLSGNLTNGVAYPVSCSIGSTLSGTLDITHTLAGDFLIKLADVYPRLQSAQFTLAADPNTNMNVFINPNTTKMGADAYANGASNTSQVGFYLVSGSGGVFEPTGSIQVHVSLALKNSTV